MPQEVIRARKLCREVSYPEVLLWQRPRGSPNGVRFRRQHPVGADYTADFHCAAARSVIEVGGEIHSQGEAPARDEGRDGCMRSRGLTVVRITAPEVLKDADGTAAAIVRLAEPPLHHRAKRRGGPPPQQAGEDR